MRIMGGAQSVGSELFNRFDITADVILGNRPSLAFTVLMIVDSAYKPSGLNSAFRKPNVSTTASPEAISKRWV